MLIWSLALRNILRNKRRTVLTLMVLTVGYISLAMAGGFMSQSFQSLADGAIRGGSGHLQFLDPRSLEGDEAMSLEFSLKDGESLAEFLRKDPAVAEVLPRIHFMGLASSGNRSVAFLGTGIDPLREPTQMDSSRHVEDGGRVPGGTGSRWLSESPDAREALVGIGLARSLGLAVGDWATLMASTADGALNAIDVDVVGFIDLGIKEKNDRFLTVSCATADELLQSGGARSRLSVMLKNPSGLDRELPRLQTLTGAVAKPWTELAGFYRQVKLLYYAIFGFMGLILGIVVLLATANTLLMSVMERVREFGTLRALGMQPGQLSAMIQSEAALLGLAGSAVGLAMTLALRLALNSLQIELPAPPGMSHGYPLDIHLVPSVYLLSFLGIQSVIHMSAWLPARRAAKLRITEALRHV